MTSVIHGVSWFFKQISLYTGPVFGLGPCDFSVWVSSSGYALAQMHGVEIFKTFNIGYFESQN